MGGSNSTESTVKNISNSYASAISSAMSTTKTATVSNQNLTVCCGTGVQGCDDKEDQEFIKNFQDLQAAQLQALTECEENVQNAVRSSCPTSGDKYNICKEATESLCSDIQQAKCGVSGVDMSQSVSVKLSSSDLEKVKQESKDDISSALKQSVSQNITGAFNFGNDTNSELSSQVDTLVEQSSYIMDKINQTIEGSQTLKTVGGYSLSNISMKQSIDVAMNAIQSNSVVQSALLRIAVKAEAISSQTADSGPFGGLIKILKSAGIIVALGLLCYVVLVVGLKSFGNKKSE